MMQSPNSSSISALSACSLFEGAEQFDRFGALRFCKLHLAENGAGDQDRRHAADRLADVFPAPSLVAFDVGQFFGEFLSYHDALLVT